MSTSNVTVTSGLSWCPHYGGLGPPFFCRECAPRQRFYVRASVVEAEQLENGRWLVRGSIFRTPTEFSDEDFRASFEQI